MTIHLRLFTALLIAGTILAGFGSSHVAAQSTPTGGPVRDVELPHGRAIALSPDGTNLAVWDRDNDALCIYAVEAMTEVSCADLSVLDTGIRVGDVVWSPDSTRLAFGENAFVYGSDGDLWVMDAATGALANLTDDQYEGSLIVLDNNEKPTFFTDIVPAWTPDSQFITFSRSGWEAGERTGNQIAQVSANGGEVETLASVTENEPGVLYFGAGWSPDGQTYYYSLTHVDPNDPDNGIWTYDNATGEVAPLAIGSDPELGPLVLRQVSPAGDRLLAYYPNAAAKGYLRKSVQRFVDPTTGAIEPIPDPNPESEIYKGSWFSTFSPDGRLLLQPADTRNGIFNYWVTDLETGLSTEVASGLEAALPVDGMLSPVWATNGLVGVARGADGVYLFAIEGAGLTQSDGATPATDTPVASPVSSPVVASVPVGGEPRLFDLPEGRAVSMSPDGTKLAVVVPPATSLCIYDVATEAQISCADLSVLNTGIRVEEIVWSPDSTRLAFGENSFLNFKDGDLWVMDAASGELTNLTDDQYDGAIMFLAAGDDDVSFTVDVSPAWTPDGRYVTFSSTRFDGNDMLGNVIAQTAADGSGAVETLTEVTATEPGVVYYGTGWSPDGAHFYYTVTHADLDDPENGIWEYDQATGATRQLAVSDDPESGPLALKAVSPAGDRLLAYYPAGLAQMLHPETSMLRFVDPESGALSPVPEPAPATEADGAMYAGTWIATFSPDGRYFLQLTGIDAGSRDVWVTDLTTGESTMVVDGLERAVPIDYRLGPIWGSNGLVFISYNVTGAWFFPIEGIAAEADAVTPTPASVSFEPGTDVRTNGITPIFAGPDAEAPIVHFLPPDHLVHVLTEPVQNDEGIWYPIFDPDTQIIGYVQASRLEQIA